MKEEAAKVVQILKDGGVVLYPTETVWGLGCHAQHEEAVQKLFTIKQRANDKSMLVLLDDDRNLKHYVKEVPEMAWDILDYATRPTTIIYPGAFNVAKNLIHEDGSLGIRITSDPFCQAVTRLLKKPLVSTSANISGQPEPQSFEEISEEILSQVDYVVNSRPAEQGKNEPSAVVKLALNGEIQIIRK